MSVDDLSEQEVIDQFANIADRNSSYIDRKNTYKNEILESEGEDIESRLKAGIERDQKHDSLLRQTISAFLPDGEIHGSGWTFLGAEPLQELNVANADALFGNPDRNLAVIVECKTSVGRPTQALEQIYDAADEIWANYDHLTDEIGMEIDELECAICVPSVHDRRIADQIEAHEQNGNDREKVFVWRVHYYDGELLDLYTEIDTRSGRDATHDSQLATLLLGGVDITHSRQVVPAIFPSSHLEVIMEEIYSSIIETRIIDEYPIRHFTDTELKEELTSQKNLPHYDAERIGDRIFEKLVSRSLNFGLIEEISSSDTELEIGPNEQCFKFKVRGKSPKTILKKLQEKYISGAIKRKADIKAKRRVLSEFDDEQSFLDDY